MSWVTGEEQTHKILGRLILGGYIYRYTPVATPLLGTRYRRRSAMRHLLPVQINVNLLLSCVCSILSSRRVVLDKQSRAAPTVTTACQRSGKAALTPILMV